MGLLIPYERVQKHSEHLHEAYRTVTGVIVTVLVAL
jgi:hypothetical protein